MSVSSDRAVSFIPLDKAYLPDILAIENEAYPEPWSPGMFREEMRNPRSHFFVMLVDGAVAGYGGFWQVLDEAHITSVTVGAAWRGQGLGRILLTHLIDAARRAGCIMATLEVRASNDVARRLYERFGFRQVGLRKMYYPKTREDAVVMLKEFGPPPEA